MAKEELKQPGIPEVNPNEEARPLDAKQLAAYNGYLETTIKQLNAKLKELTKEVEFYQMQDYYQRAQFLLAVVSNDSITDELRRRCHRELEALLFPSEQENPDKGK